MHTILDDHMIPACDLIFFYFYRHACYLLELLHRHMDNFDLKNVTLTLEQVVKEALDRCLTTPTYASSVAGKLVSPIPLIHFPSVCTFYPRPLIKKEAPLRRAGFTSQSPPTNELNEGKVSSYSPFIYSPFGPGKKKGKKRREVLWVEEDPAEIALSISNPLPFELRVDNMVQYNYYD